MKRALFALLLLPMAAFGAAARTRVVRHPADACALSISPTFANAAVPAAGMTHGVVAVFGQTQPCSQWAAYSDASWVTVEPAPQDAQPAAYVTVAPNPVGTPRSTTLVIAGLRLDITQDGATPVAPPIENNLLVNGTFDKNVTSWGWYARYPNGIGAAEWSQLDANGVPVSGSMLMRDVDYDRAQSFQRLQCVRIDGGFHEFGAKVRTGSAAGFVEMAFIAFESTDCSEVGERKYVNRYVESVRPAEPGVWQRFDFVRGANGIARSAIIVLAVAADPAPPFEVWFDDVYLRKKQ